MACAALSLFADAALFCPDTGASCATGTLPVALAEARLDDVFGALSKCNLLQPSSFSLRPSVSRSPALDFEVSGLALPRSLARYTSELDR